MALPVLATRMHRWEVSCLRIMNLKLSALCPLVPLSSAKGGSQPSGGTMHAMPALHTGVYSIRTQLAARRHNQLIVQKVSAIRKNSNPQDAM